MDPDPEEEMTETINRDTASLVAGEKVRKLEWYSPTKGQMQKAIEALSRKNTTVTSLSITNEFDPPLGSEYTMVSRVCRDMGIMLEDNSSIVKLELSGWKCGN